MESKPEPSFTQLLVSRLNSVIKEKFSSQTLSPPVMRSIRETIKEEVSLLLNSRQASVDAKTLVWITNQFFKSIVVNGVESMNDLIILNDYKLSELPYNDIVLLRVLLERSKLAPDLDAELQHRRQEQNES